MVDTIILDIDGVFIPYPYPGMKRPPLDEEKFSFYSTVAFQSILGYYNPETLIITSGKNSLYKTPAAYTGYFRNNGISNLPVKIIVGDQHERYRYVEMKIKMNNLENYLIIDDEPGGYFSRPDVFDYKRILAPNRYRGLDMYDAILITNGRNL